MYNKRWCVQIKDMYTKKWSKTYNLQLIIIKDTTALLTQEFFIQWVASEIRFLSL